MTSWVQPGSSTQSSGESGASRQGDKLVGTAGSNLQTQGRSVALSGDVACWLWEETTTAPPWCNEQCRGVGLQRSAGSGRSRRLAGTLTSKKIHWKGQLWRGPCPWQ
jgi:hypothetical protein